MKTISPVLALEGENVISINKCKYLVRNIWAEGDHPNEFLIVQK